MTARNDVIIDWQSSPRIITVLAPSTSITVQDLLDTCREAEDELVNMVYPPLASASGKDDLGGGDLTGITVKLLNALLAFEARGGPSFVKCQVNAGNLVAVDSGGVSMDPIANTAYTQVKVTLSVSAALIPGSSGATPSDIADAVWDEALSLHNSPGTTGEALANAGLTPEQAKQLLMIFINSL